MSPSTYAHVNPSVLRWARESVGYSTHEAASKLDLWTWQLEAAEAGVDLLTLRQAEKVAEVYDRPLVTFFLPEPPQEEPQEVQFRRLPGAPPPPWPPEMARLSRRIRQRQHAAEELLDVLDEEPGWPSTASSLAGVDPGRLAAIVRKRLGVSHEEQSSWQDRSGYAALRAWVDAVESQGAFVMQDGTMAVEQLRGFAALHPTVPVIVINTRDDPRARAFTLLHEFGHLALTASGADAGSSAEAWCNAFAGDVLMPADPFTATFRSTGGTLSQRVGQTALVFGVTTHAAAVRIDRLSLATSEAIGELIRGLEARPLPDRPSGGDYYRNKVTWLGPAFVRLVLEGAENQAVTLSNAAGLLEAKVNQFSRLRATLNRRGEFG